jgi:hypothetical protein
MRTTEVSEGVNHDRRRFVGTAAMSVAAAGVASLLPEARSD